MTSQFSNPLDLPHDLGGGLILRRSRADDVEALAEFNQRIHTEDDDPRDPVPRLAFWVRDLLSGRHPSHAVDDFTLVEDTASGKIVSCMSLISQTWSYDGISFGVGRPELVATETAYRKRGLVRAQFQVAHALSARRGELVQAITGIPYYYRQFGYEMTLQLDSFRRGYAPQNVPALPENTPEPFLLRPAQPADLAFIAELYAHGCQRSLVSCQRDTAMWHYNLDGESSESVNRREIRVLHTPQGEALGFLTHPDYLWWNGSLALTQLEILPGRAWNEVVPVVIRYLVQQGEKYAARDGQTCSGFGFMLGKEHPAYTAAGRALPVEGRPYTWYIRVPDVAAFITHITPVLEKRLADSDSAGMSGEFKIDFYRGALRLVLESGRISAVENITLNNWLQGNAAFPPYTFNHLLFGHHSLEEIRAMYTDCYADDKAAALLNALFPKKASQIWPIH